MLFPYQAVTCHGFLAGLDGSLSAGFLKNGSGRCCFRKRCPAFRSRSVGKYLVPMPGNVETSPSELKGKSGAGGDAFEQGDPVLHPDFVAQRRVLTLQRITAAD